MECPKFLFISGLLFNGAIAYYNIWRTCPIDTSEYRLPTEVMMCSHYHIELIRSTIPDTEEYRIEAIYFIEIRGRTRKISLHSNERALVNIDMKETLLTGTGSSKRYFPFRYAYCPEPMLLVIDFETILPLGNYTLNLQMKDKVANDRVPGFSKIYYGDDENKK